MAGLVSLVSEVSSNLYCILTSLGKVTNVNASVISCTFMPGRQRLSLSRRQKSDRRTRTRNLLSIRLGDPISLPAGGHGDEKELLA